MVYDPTKIILGTANLGGLFLDGVEPDTARAVAIIGEARSMGISRFDTAPLYGWGASEFFLGRALDTLQIPRESVYLSSKSLRSLFPCVEGRDGTQPDFWTLGEPNRSFTHKWRVDYDSVMQTTLRSLEALRTSYLNGLSLHDIGDAFAEDPTMTWERLDDGLRAHNDLKRAGFIREVGFGSKETQTLPTLVERHPGLLSYVSTTTYTLIDQEFLKEKMFEFCAEHHLEFRVAGPFCSRLLAQDPRTAVRCPGKDGISRWYYRGDLDMPVTFNYTYINDSQYQKACRLWQTVQEFGELNPRAAALQFVMAHPAVGGVIIGASTREHLHELKNSLERRIDPHLFDALKKQGIVAENAPVPGAS